jgi:hypothetical protein
MPKLSLYSKYINLGTRELFTFGFYILHDESEHTIFEVIGEHPEFKSHVRKAKPNSTLRHTDNILVGTINKHDVEHLKTYMAEVSVDK